MVVTNACRLVLILVTLSAYLSKIALSDGKNHRMVCDFETRGLCSWDGDIVINGYWHRMSGKDNNATFGPFADHTLQIDQGSFLSLVKTGPRRRCNDATLIKRKVKLPPGGMCFSFWYFMEGDENMTLRLDANFQGKLKVNPRESSFDFSPISWSKRGSQGPDWRQGRVFVPRMFSHFQLAFKASLCSARDPSLSLDDFQFKPGPCTITHDCDFDNGFCDYSQSPDNDFDWLRANARDKDNGNQIQEKHFRGKIDGGFSYLNFTVALNAGDTAILLSPEFTDKKPVCFRFWYNVKGSVDLDVFQSMDERSSNSLWSWDKNDALEEWRLAMITVQGEQPYRLAFKATIGNRIDEDRWLSVDDIDTTPGHCYETNSCDFEDASCTWRNNLVGGVIGWVRTSVGRESNGHVVRVDHTLGTKYGKFLLLNGTSSKLSKLKAELISVPLAPQLQFCLNFWYVIESSGHIDISLTRGRSPNLVHRIETHPGRGWASFRETIPSFESWSRLVIEGVTDPPNQGRIYLDDLHLQEGECEMSAPPSRRSIFHCSKNGLTLSRENLCDFHNDCPDGEEEEQCGYTCDFESGGCKWTPLANHYSLWNRTSGIELNGTIGPHDDHTSGTNAGTFLYALHSTYSHQYKIISPFLKSSTDNCHMSFYVFVTDPQAWIITVTKIVADRIQTRFASKKLKERVWNKLTISVGHTIEPFQMQIEARSILKKTHAIALDDLSFEECDFYQSPSSQKNENIFPCSNGIAIPSNRVCDSVNDCIDNSDESNEICSNYTQCNFNTDICQWSQERILDDDNWSRVTANTLHYPYIGPEYDHTSYSSTGGVLQLASWIRSPGDRAWILSPVFNPSHNCTLVLYLFLRTGQHDLFNIYSRNEQGGNLTRHMSTTGEAGRLWTFKSVTFTSNSPFQIILEGVRGYGWYVEMAVDDISLSPECTQGQWESKDAKTRSSESFAIIPELSTTIPSTENTTASTNGCQHPDSWQCLDQSLCLHISQRCDFKPQCPDQSDEKNCGSCDFESTTCGWTDLSAGVYGWGLENLSIDSNDMSDHTVEALYQVANQSMDPQFMLNDTVIDLPNANVYMGIRHTGQEPAGVSVLASPVLGSTSSSCTVTFNYHDSPHGSTSLYLYTGRPSSYTNSKEGLFLWRSTNASTSWAKETVSIASLAAGFHLVFKSRPVSFSTTAISAIDNVIFNPTCGDVIRWTWCLADEFMCRNSTSCKPNHARCDLTKDCPHGDDEEGCDSFRMGNFYDRTLFYPDETGDFQWISQKIKSDPKEPMPMSDHTGRGPKGRFLYMNATSKKKVVERARVVSYVMHPTSKGDCFLRLFYWSAGDRYGFVDIYTVTSDGTETKLWSMKNKKVDDWTKVVLPLKPQQDFGIVIEGIRHRPYRGGIAIDDVTISPECHYDNRYRFKVRAKKRFRLTCEFDFKHQRRIRYRYLSCSKNCTFDNDTMCGWTQKNRKKSIPWFIESLVNVSRLDPKVERSFDRVLMVGSAAGKDGKRPKLLHSPIIRNAGMGCTFSFRYYYVGRVSIFYISLRTLREMERVYYEGPDWDKKKGPSGKWNTLSVAIPPNTGEFRIVIYLFMDTKLEKNSFFMMDNFTFSDCRSSMTPKFCRVGQSLCDNGNCISDDQLCDLENHCGDWSDESGERCSRYEKFTFENSMMDWKRDVSTQYRWSLRKGWKRRGRFNFGRPASDHTTLFKDGHYLSTTEQMGNARKAIILYEMDSLTDPCDVVFWYQMRCVHQHSCWINIYTKTLYGLQNIVQNFTSDSQALRWEKGSFRVMKNESFQLIFEGILDGEPYSTLNMDDIIFSPHCIGHRQRQQKTPKVTSVQPVIFLPCNQSRLFHCASARGHTCVHSGRVCDFNTDCLDGSDERDCHTNTVCEFDDDTCNWWSGNVPSFSWSLTKSLESLSSQEFPVAPVSGHYVFLNLTNPAVRNVRAMPDFYSPRFKSSGPSCVIRFQYYLTMSGKPERNALTLHIVTSRRVVGLIWKISRSDNQWREAVIGIGRRLQPFYLFFRLYAETNSSTFVALDQIQYENCSTVSSRETICPNSHFQCRIGGCIPERHVCNRQSDCPDGSDESLEICRRFSVIDFEDPNSLHQFVHKGDGELAWRVSYRSHPLSMPDGLGAIDHTTWTNQGHYLVLAGHSRSTNTDGASIVSRTYLSPDKTCTIRFHAMIPSKAQSIIIGYITDDSDSKATSDKTVAFDGPIEYGSFWQHLTVSITVGRPFRLVITGIVGVPDGAIGIDDVILGSNCHPAR